MAHTRSTRRGRAFCDHVRRTATVHRDRPDLCGLWPHRTLDQGRQRDAVRPDRNPSPALRMTAPNNVLLLYAARGLRGFGDGFAIIILPAYLTAIGYDPIQIGFVATASLLGTALL